MNEIGTCKKFFIVIGLFILSQISITIFGLIQEISPHSLVGGNLLALILLIMVNIIILVWLTYKLKLIEFNFTWITKTNLFIIIGSTILLKVIAIMGTLLIQYFNGQEISNNDAALNSLFNGVNPVLLFLLIAISAPIMEEIVFRGGIIGLLCKNKPIIGILLSSISFGLIHMATDIPNFLLYALMGLILSLSYYKSKRLEVSIMVHFLNNVIPAIAMIFLQ